MKHRYAIGARVIFEPDRPKPGRTLRELVEVVAHGTRCYVIRTYDNRTFVADEDELSTDRSAAVGESTLEQPL